VEQTLDMLNPSLCYKRGRIRLNIWRKWTIRLRKHHEASCSFDATGWSYLKIGKAVWLSIQIYSWIDQVRSAVYI